MGAPMGPPPIGPPMGPPMGPPGIPWGGIPWPGMPGIWPPYLRTEHQKELQLGRGCLGNYVFVLKVSINSSTHTMFGWRSITCWQTGSNLFHRATFSPESHHFLYIGRSYNPIHTNYEKTSCTWGHERKPRYVDKVILLQLLYYYLFY